jgi:hypothetical protein
MNLGVRVHLEDLGVDGKIILKFMCQEMGWGRVTGVILLKIGLL